jgi:hypothetical protein
MWIALFAFAVAAFVCLNVAALMAGAEKASTEWGAER